MDPNLPMCTCSAYAVGMLRSSFFTQNLVHADESSAESTSGRNEDDSWFMDYVGLSLRYLQVKLHNVA